MKVSIRWIREWVSPRVTDAALAERLTLAGLECEAVAVDTPLHGIVVGEITAVAQHPQADRLTVCEVDVGEGRPLTIVCGAANARKGLRAPVARVGARLPDGTEIRRAALRGVESDGMLCSAKELGLADRSEGLLELDGDARIGQPVAAHLGLKDSVLVLELTPNRGDCLSVRGLAREVAALYGLSFREPARRAPRSGATRRVAVRLESRADCPHYAGRVIEGISARARTPDWMRERLRRSGLRCLHPVVDVTNYVMLEVGQPLHAFDGAKLQGGIRVRRARAGEQLELLNGQTVTFSPDDLVIADEERALALAGIMGGLASGVTSDTIDIFLESACFDPERVAATGRRLKIPSDALYRFERGVDPTLQRAALDRAAALIVEICGGVAGPVTGAGAREPKAPRVRLRRARLDQLLGHAIPDRDVERSLTRLGLGVKRQGKSGWEAQIPGHRYDLRMEVDLIEEVARLYGYDRIPARPYAASYTPAPVPERDPSRLAGERLVARGWQEAVTYSMVDAKLQTQLGDAVPVELDNPLAETMTQLRTTLWSGLIPAWRYNQQRQQKRVRLFEVGVCFAMEGERIVETERLAALAAGAAAPEQWGIPGRPVDFYDVKADIEAVCAGVPDIRFEPGRHPALQPGRTARILRGADVVGWLGTLHPGQVRALDLPEAPVLVELDLARLRHARVVTPLDPSEFPSSRRDLAVVLPDETPAAALLEQVRAAAGPLLRETGVFDQYRGGGLPNGFKSVALSLIFQDNSRTLTDQEVDAAVQAVAHRLQSGLGATIRGDSSGGVDQSGVGRGTV